MTKYYLQHKTEKEFKYLSDINTKTGEEIRKVTNLSNVKLFSKHEIFHTFINYSDIEKNYDVYAVEFKTNNPVVVTMELE
jgi:hypothetical protein